MLESIEKLRTAFAAAVRNLPGPVRSRSRIGADRTRPQADQSRTGTPWSEALEAKANILRWEWIENPVRRERATPGQTCLMLKW